MEKNPVPSFGKLTSPCLGSEGKTEQGMQRTKQGSKLKIDTVPSDSNYILQYFL